MVKLTRVSYNPSVSAGESGEDVVYANAEDFTVDEMPTTSVALKTEEQNKRTFSVPPHVTPIAVCWAILLLIVGLRIHFTAVLSTKLRNEMQVVAEYEDFVTYLMSDFISTEENFKRNQSKLKDELDEMTEAHKVLEANLTELRRENQQVKEENQQLKEENQQLKKENQRLKENNQTTDSSTTQIPYPMSVSPVYWRYKREIREKEMQNGSNVGSDHRNLLPRREPCHMGWIHFLSSCYSISDSPDQKTWREARDDCRGKDADLVSVESPEEQGFIFNSSLVSLEVDGFWIGLRVEKGDWTWVDGRHLTEDYRIHRPADGRHCAISVEEPGGWKAESCDVRRGWICEKIALSV